MIRSRASFMAKLRIVGSCIAALVLVLVTPAPRTSRASSSAEPTPWPIAGANPQRTGWTPETLPSGLKTLWVKPIVPYVPQHAQVIGAEGKVFVSTAAGLFAFAAGSGELAWTYPTALPLGHSPTYDAGFLYVGGLDKQLHKVAASDGAAVWTFAGEGGFVTSPIVAGGRAFAGCRDGAFYAVNVSDGTLAWKYQTGNQILQSAAFQDDVLYFASNDGHAYALRAQDGSLLWQSAKLPSKGFHSFWPVMYRDYVVLMRTTFGSGTNGEENARLYCPAENLLCAISNQWTPGLLGTESGDWAAGSSTLDVNSNAHGMTYADYFEAYPHYRNAIFLERATGDEVAFDIDNDGITDAAPVAWAGDNGSPSPPIVSGHDGVIYFRTNTRGAGGFGSKTLGGWKVGTGILSVPFSNTSQQSGFWPGDEPTAFSAAGDKIYWNHCCDRYVGAVSISQPNTDFLANADDGDRQWSYISSGGLNYGTWPSNIGMPVAYFTEAVKFFWDPQPAADPPCCAAVFWNENDKVGPAVYDGRLYVVLGNALVALAADGAGSTAPLLPSAPTVTSSTRAPALRTGQLRDRLERETSAIVAAGHLQPTAGYDFGHHSRAYDRFMGHYWHNPSDIQVVLLRALPFLSSELQAQVKSYLQAELASYSPATYAHVGFSEGVRRDLYPYPPAETLFRTFPTPTIGKQTSAPTRAWGFPPHNLYALWKYAQAGLGDPATLLAAWDKKLKAPITANNAELTDAILEGFPGVSNAYIAGYTGYVELAKLAGRPTADYAAFESELARLLTLRAETLTAFPNPQQPWLCENECYYESIITYHNFAYLTPELASYLVDHAGASVRDIVDTYQAIAPYWMQAHNGATQGEFTIMPYQQTHSLFQALARVKRASQQELSRRLDTPIVPVGDLYFVDNLVAALEAPVDPSDPIDPPGDGSDDPGASGG